MHQTFEPLWIDYCAYFNGNADFFECHEALEELWKDVAPGQKDHVLVGLIQVATGLYHWRRNNFRGAKKALSNAIHLLERHVDCSQLKAIDVEALLVDCRKSLDLVVVEVGFVLFKLGFVDRVFEELVTVRIARLPELDEEYIVHKHKLRDRSEVIAARLERLVEKRS